MDKILIVVDMQNDFIDGALGTPEAQDIVPEVWEKIKNWDSPYILYTMDTHIKEFYVGSVEGEKVPFHCEMGSKGWKMNPYIWNALIEFGLEKAGNHIEKIEKDTFTGFEIPSYIDFDIKPENPFKIEIVGLCTDICVISNALFLRSLYPMAKIVVDAACCAGTTKENHLAALNVMKANCIEVKNMEV